MISILTKPNRIIAAVLTALVISTAPALGQAAAQAPERSSVLRYASLNGNIRGELHMLPPVSTGPMSPTWSPDGRWIAFAMAGDIWRIPANGGTAEQLTRGPRYHFEPDWSPDGSRIVMTVETGRGLDIALLEMDGGEVTLLVEGGGVDVQPAWGPEGRFVYFAAAGRAGMDIHRIEVATGRREAVVEGPGDQYQPRVSAQGVLAYMAPAPGVTGSGGIWTRRLPEPGDDAWAGSSEPVLARSEETAYRARPDWLPDGSALVYVSDEAGSNDLVLIGAGGGNPLRLTGGESHELTPRVSPDGNRIAFVSNETGPTELNVVAVSGGARSSWQTLDLGNRAHLDPAGRLRATVLDGTGNPTPARVTVYGPDGRGYTPGDGFHRVLTPTETHYFRTAGTVEVEVPAGPVTIQVRKGLEYRPIHHTLEVTPGDNPELSLRLDRLIDARDLGWYSGDTHVHDLHQGRYGLTHEDFFNDIASEDLRVAIALIHMDGTRLMGRWDDLTGHPHPLSTGEHILQYAQEFRGSFGHVGLAGLDRFITPLIGGAANTPFAADLLNADYLDAAREMGGTGGFMHPFHGPVDTPEARRALARSGESARGLPEHDAPWPRRPGRGARRAARQDRREASPRQALLPPRARLGPGVPGARGLVARRRSGRVPHRRPPRKGAAQPARPAPRAGAERRPRRDALRPRRLGGRHAAPLRTAGRRTLGGRRAAAVDHGAGLGRRLPRELDRAHARAARPPRAVPARLAGDAAAARRLAGVREGARGRPKRRADGHEWSGAPNAVGLRPQRRPG